MATVLKLQNITAPYRFISLGVYNTNNEAYGESSLFPINSVVTLTSGKFPLTDYRNMYQHSDLTHVIGGKTVRITEFSNDCRGDILNRYGGCEIHVEEHITGGKRHRRQTKKQRSKRSRRRGSSRRH
jgi:hypothetical protein